MFTPTGAFSGFSVNDIEAAFTFYSDTLGLEVERNSMGFLNIVLASGARILAYSKPNHEPATFTILNFEVADVGAAVADLATRGLTMTRYEGMPQDDDGVMRGNGPEIAWFTDPAGNVLSVVAAAG